MTHKAPFRYQVWYVNDSKDNRHVRSFQHLDRAAAFARDQWAWVLTDRWEGNVILDQGIDRRA